MIAFNLTIILLFMLLLPSVVKSCKNSNIVDILNKDSALTLRGIAIIVIVLHHFSQYFENLGILQTPIQQCGYAVTAVFFFFSGYGCFCSYRRYRGLRGKQKIKFSSLWFLKHSFRLYVDFLIIYAINLILIFVFKTEDITLGEAIKNLFTITLPGWVSWYPKIQILCYFILSITYIVSDKNKTHLTLCIILLYIIIAYFLKLQSMWYTSVICFPLGMLVAERLPKTKDNKNRHIVVFLVSSLVFAGLFFLQMRIHPSVVRLTSSLLIPLIVTAATGIVQFKSRILSKLGQWSFEIYLIHLIILRIMINSAPNAITMNSNLSLIIILVISVLLGWIVNKAAVFISENVFSNLKTKAKRSE